MAEIFIAEKINLEEALLVLAWRSMSDGAKTFLAKTLGMTQTYDKESGKWEWKAGDS